MLRITIVAGVLGNLNVIILYVTVKALTVVRTVTDYYVLKELEVIGVAKIVKQWL